eukprot:2208279-Amphidinium_carterae.2
MSSPRSCQQLEGQQWHYDGDHLNALQCRLALGSCCMPHLVRFRRSKQGLQNIALTQQCPAGKWDTTHGKNTVRTASGVQVAWVF